MSWYDKKENAEKYMSMAEGHDGALLINDLKEYLPASSSVLELGMGPGKDFKLLQDASFIPCGSDCTQNFLDLFKSKHPDADVLFLDAVSIETDRKFDCIYSNKVLIHLSKEDLRESFRRQNDVLKGPGIAIHSFWKGSDVEQIGEGTFCTNHTEASLREATQEWFDVLKLIEYTELKEESEDIDSLYVVLKKRVSSRLES